MSENLNIWNKFSKPPQTALKTIQAGRLKGKSDINPQWRYKAMTEAFGICGIGWKYTEDERWIVQGANNETMCFVKVSVFVKVDGEWSSAIPATGGSTLVASEKNGMYNNDDGYKMAMTDALSVALAKLGVAADVYMGLFDGTKYRETKTETTELPIDSQVPTAKKPTSDPERKALVEEFSKAFNALPNKAGSKTINGNSTIEEIKSALEHNKKLAEAQNEKS